MVFELEDAGGSLGRSKPGDWDRFQVRNIGLAVQRRMAATNGGDAEKFKLAAFKKLTDVIGMRADALPHAGLSALHDFAAALSLVADLRRWSDAEKRALAKVIHAKAGLDESNYLKLMQKHARLRQTIIDLGSH
jgi:uncharacterized protein (DUF2132 family)